MNVCKSTDFCNKFLFLDIEDLILKFVQLQVSVEARGGGDGELFVLDTEGVEVVEVEEVNKKSLTVAATPKHDLEEEEEHNVSPKTLGTKGKDDVFDATKILTNDVALSMPSEEKKERLFLTYTNLMCGSSTDLYGRIITILVHKQIA